MRKVLPRYFYNFRSCISLIDCFEIFIQRSLGLNSRAQSWSSYKFSNTIKYLISITPIGSVLKAGVSDLQITIQAVFLINRVQYSQVFSTCLKLVIFSSRPRFPEVFPRFSFYFTCLSLLRVRKYFYLFHIINFFEAI